MGDRTVGTASGEDASDGIPGAARRGADHAPRRRGEGEEGGPMSAAPRAPRRGIGGTPVRLAAAFLLAASLAALGRQPVGAAERIAAIVNNNVILSSDVDDRF